MATTINPAVSGVSYRRWVFHVGLYALGVCLGALVTYAFTHVLYVAIGALVSPTAWLVLALPLVGLAALRDLGVQTPLPYPAQTQVPEWLRGVVPPSVTALAYGGQLGTGFLTRFTYSTHTAFVVVLATESSTSLVGFTVLAFALAKSIVILTSLGGRSYSTFEERILRRHRTRLIGQKLLRTANAVVALAAASIFAINL
jgi:hypothetical protein